MAPAAVNAVPRFHEHFTLSITKALGDQLAAALAVLDRVPLTESNIGRLEPKAGVYQLYLDGEFVYVGKADRSLPSRLRNHHRKLSGRRNISLDRMTFSCLYVAEDFSALAPEQLLISHHKGSGDIPWNNNGFGNKDPGKQRDNTILKPNHFDMAYPIDLDLPVVGLAPGTVSLSSFLETVKAGIPYNFRYEPPADADATVIQVPDRTIDAAEAFQLISSQAPDDWQVTALMGYVIMYRESPREYSSAWRYYRAGQPVPTTPRADTSKGGSSDKSPTFDLE